MAATRLIALHQNKGKSVAACLKSRTDYAQNPEKTAGGEMVSSYGCSPLTVDEEFLLCKRQYEQSTGRSQKNNVIAYQIRQSFKPGEITPEEANKVGYELAMRWTKGKYQFFVCTHTDRQHIHNHILYNSTSMDGSRKFRDFWLSGLAVQRLSDVICLEHKLSVIETKPYRERQKRILYPPKESNRDHLCAVIDNILRDKPSDFDAFLQKLEQEGYEVKRGKHTSVKGKRQKRFIRFRTLGAGYSEEEIRAVLEGRAEHKPRQRPEVSAKEDTFRLLIDLAAKQNKGTGYQRWAKKFNLKEISKTLIFLQENKLTNMDELNDKADVAVKRFHELQETIKAAEKRMAEIAELRTQIIQYAKTHDVYAAYRKAGYSKKFRAEHEAEILLHQAAKEFFDKQGIKKLPKVKDLNAEYAELLMQKKEVYPEYRKAREEMQRLLRAQKNIERFFAEETPQPDRQQSR
ncbi:relaxase/mobilization nuclease domain-containing protein [Faecalibacterium sp. An121]|uniref:relaxase/mobilization nuclease domain-containing protein n=1 Tax=Faecalibacterium sp. An121 TaxID=1965550 RepID=UPI000B3ADBC9|nr:relaxase/mobilization nuclease domain-containing protein [Faecalibacterium sp. An121]OUQ37406.1 relaxase [Faecalibacterium sp. An121]